MLENLCDSNLGAITIHVGGPSAGRIKYFRGLELARGPYFAHHWCWTYRP
jgi:hypothetical protein